MLTEKFTRFTTAYSKGNFRKVIFTIASASAARAMQLPFSASTRTLSYWTKALYIQHESFSQATPCHLPCNTSLSPCIAQGKTPRHTQEFIGAHKENVFVTQRTFLSLVLFHTAKARPYLFDVKLKLAWSNSAVQLIPENRTVNTRCNGRKPVGRRSSRCRE